MKSREVPPKEDLNLLNCDPGQAPQDLSVRGMGRFIKPIKEAHTQKGLWVLQGEAP